MHGAMPQNNVHTLLARKVGRAYWLSGLDFSSRSCDFIKAEKPRAWHCCFQGFGGEGVLQYGA
jgi:hypothetical protein